MNWDELKQYVEPALVSKIEEFKLLGYDKVNQDELWNCLRAKVWKKDEEPKSVREIVNDILGLSIGVYMSYITIEAYKAPNFFSS